MHPDTYTAAQMERNVIVSRAEAKLNEIATLMADFLLQKYYF